MQVAHLGAGASGAVQIVERTRAPSTTAGDEEPRLFAAKVLHEDCDLSPDVIARHRCLHPVHSDEICAERTNFMTQVCEQGWLCVYYITACD